MKMLYVKQPGSVFCGHALHDGNDGFYVSHMFYNDENLENAWSLTDRAEWTIIFFQHTEYVTSVTNTVRQSVIIRKAAFLWMELSLLLELKIVKFIFFCFVFYKIYQYVFLYIPHFKVGN